MADKVKKMKEAVAANRKVKGGATPPTPRPPAPEPEEQSASARDRVFSEIVAFVTLRGGWDDVTPLMLAEFLVKKFPVLAAKPKSKTRRCCGTLVGSAPHRPDCVQLTHGRQP